MDLGAVVVADEESFELVQPGEGSLDDPAVAAKAGAVLGLASCDLGCDAAPAKLAAAVLVVVASVGADTVGSATRPADLAPDRRHPIDQRDELGYVVAVAARERPRQREPAGLYEQVVLGAAASSVHRARARFRAPFLAWM